MYNKPLHHLRTHSSCFLRKFEETWNSLDVQGRLDLWHDDAKIMGDIPRRIVPKEELKKDLGSGMVEAGTIDFGTPKIDVSGKGANVKILVHEDDGNKIHWVTFSLAKENNLTQPIQLPN